MPATHEEQLEAPAEEEEPAKQLTHVAFEAAPVADEEVPAAQFVHAAIEVRVALAANE